MSWMHIIRNAFLIGLIYGLLSLTRLFFSWTIILLADLALIFISIIIFTYAIRKERKNLSKKEKGKVLAFSALLAFPLIIYLTYLADIPGDAGLTIVGAWIWYLIISVILLIVGAIYVSKNKNSAEESEPLSRSSKAIFLCTLIAVILLILGIHIYTFYEANECSLLKRGYHCYIDYSLDTGEDYCHYVTNTISKDECYFGLASMTGDKTFCEKLSTEDRKLGCRESFVEANNCPAFESESSRDTCYWKEAVRDEDISICDKIVGSFLKMNCVRDIAEIKNNPELCLILEDEENRLNCLTNLASMNNNANACDYIESSEGREGCIDNARRRY